MSGWEGPLDAATLTAAYRDGALTPLQLVEEVLARIAARGEDHVWIDPPQAASLRAAAEALTDCDPSSLPLYGLPFAVKDNIDVAGRSTTAACPAAAWEATANATVVQRLLDAGALLVGKTNLDQFATGLVGTRSPYGAPSSVFDDRDISGGSSSGSAVAVGAGLVSFALGTDTAGSGRVPAGCNNVVGLKPTPGVVPTTGVFPACRSLDCVSVFALTVADALGVLGVMAGPDGQDAYARPQVLDLPPVGSIPAVGTPVRFGIPSSLEFFGDADFAAAYDAAVARARGLGWEGVELDFAPFLEVADLLYEGPWVAERLAALEPRFDELAPHLHHVIRGILEGARRWSAADAFTAAYRLEELRREIEGSLQDLDLLLVPTTGTSYTRAEVEADPVGPNRNLGHYTNFVNLLGLAAVAVPSAFTPQGRPVGVTLIGAGGSDGRLAAAAAKLHQAAGVPMGATGSSLPPAPVTQQRPAELDLVVVGAHLRGQPLNHQLRELGASYRTTTATAPCYRLFVLADGQRPGLVRDTTGAAIEVEVWRVPMAAFGRLAVQVSPPLSFGSIELSSGQRVLGFLCESHAISAAHEITHAGGWRAYLAAGDRAPSASHGGNR